MDIIDLEISDEEQLDFKISLVDRPAIERDWIAFKRINRQFQIESKDKRIVSGYAMIANMEIDRMNPDGTFYKCKFTPDSINKIALNFMRNGLTKNTNLNHSQEELAQGVYVFESIILDSERGMKAPDKFEQEADGSWFISMKIDNDDIWKSVLDGTFKGFSVEGLFEESFMSQLESIFKRHI